MRIAIDVDSTLHHYWDQLASIAQRRFGVTLPYEDQVTWSIDRLSRDQLVACVEETHTEEHVLAAVPYPGAVEAVAAWHRAGHWIHVTSHRAGGAHEATARWLDRVGIPYDDLHCSYDKVSRCVELGIDVLVDDSPVNLRRARDVGILGATIVHPWNRDLCRGDGVVCGEDWPALAAALEPVLAGGRAA